MAKELFTPGPWVVANGLQVWKDGLNTVGSPRICTIQNAADPVWQLSGAEMHANARLIAAAPSMYEALNKAIQYLRHPKAAFGDRDADAERREVYEVVQAALSLASPEKNTPPT